MQLIVQSFDGFMYIIDGYSGCSEKIDIGEHSYSMVLVDDIDEDGKLDLVASTMNGNVYAFRTATDYDALKTWRSANNGQNGHTAQWNHRGVRFLSQVKREVMGATVPIQFEIVDAARDRRRENGGRDISSRKYTLTDSFVCCFCC